MVVGRDYMLKKHGRAFSIEALSSHATRAARGQSCRRAGSGFEPSYDKDRHSPRRHPRRHRGRDGDGNGPASA